MKKFLKLTTFLAITLGAKLAAVKQQQQTFTPAIGELENWRILLRLNQVSEVQLWM